MEALRLADAERLHHEAGGQQMGISRATFGRILERARKKVALALVHGRCLEIVEK